MPNKKGHGFSFFEIPQNQHKLKNQAIYGTIIGIALLCGTLFFFGKHATPDFIILISALMTLCSMTLYNILSRQIQDRDIEERIHDLTRTQDRLVRGVSRNRHDIDAIKAKKYEMAIASGAVLDLNTPIDRHSRIVKFKAAPPATRAMPKSKLEKAFQAEERQFSETVIAELIHHATSNDNIDLFMQPVVKLPQRQVRFYEVFGRIHAGRGQYLSARDYGPVARRYNEDKQLDTILLLRALRMLKTKSLKGSESASLMLNVSLSTMNNRGFVNELVTFLSRDPSFAKRLVFEFSQHDVGQANAKTLSLLKHLGKLGCRFSMDSITSRKIDIVKLRHCSISFIKLDAAWLLRESKAKNGYSNVLKIKKQLEQSGIELIVEKIETETQLRELLDMGIATGQGYLCGKPDLNSAFIESMKSVNLKNKQISRHIQNKPFVTSQDKTADKVKVARIVSKQNSKKKSA